MDEKIIFSFIKVVLSRGCKIRISHLYRGDMFKRGIEEAVAQEGCMTSGLQNMDVATDVVSSG